MKSVNRRGHTGDGGRVGDGGYPRLSSWARVEGSPCLAHETTVASTRWWTTKKATRALLPYACGWIWRRDRTRRYRHQWPRVGGAGRWWLARWWRWWLRHWRSRWWRRWCLWQAQESSELFEQGVSDGCSHRGQERWVREDSRR
jgi:hypothetical protein